MKFAWKKKRARRELFLVLASSSWAQNGPNEHAQTINYSPDQALTTSTTRATSFAVSVGGARLSLSTASTLRTYSVDGSLICPTKQVVKASRSGSLSIPSIAHLSRHSSQTNRVFVLGSVPSTSNQTVPGPLTITRRSRVQDFVKETRDLGTVLSVGGMMMSALLEFLLI